MRLIQVAEKGISKKAIFGLIVLAIALCTTAVSSYGQGITTGSLAGTVQDPQGAVIPQASITVVQDATQATFKTVSQADGAFLIHNLPIGKYTVTIESAGFTPLRIGNLVVTAGETAQAGVQKLAIGASTSVTVQSALPILDTNQAQVTTDFDTAQLQNLPLNSSFDNVALLAPGVVQTHDASFSNSNGDGLSANGQRGRSNNFEIDGQNNNDADIAGPQLQFGSADAIGEIQVLTENFGAQYGRNMGTVVNYITKSGSNTFHGTGFELYTGSWLSSLQNGQKTPLDGFCAPGEDPSSTGCTPVTVPRTVENKYGGTLGGPVIKDKLWFFGSTYWDPVRQGGAVSTSAGNITPTPTGIAQLEAAFPGNPAVASIANQGPFAIKAGNPSVLAGSTSMQSVTDGVTPALIEFGQIARTVPALSDDQEDLGRLDWQPSSKDHFFVRYFYQEGDATGQIENTATAIASGGYVNESNVAHSVGADWTHTFSPSWVNQVRYGFQQTKVFFQGGGTPDCTTFNFAACPSTVTFQDGNEVSYGYTNTGPQSKTIKVTQVQDNANWTHGSHDIAIGGEIDHQNAPSVFLPNYIGSLVFNGILDAPAGSTSITPGVSDFLAPNGTDLLALTDGNPVVALKENDAALYFQDNWKIRHDLTLNLGLRWEFFGQAVNGLHDETVARETGSNPLWNTALPLSVRTYQKVPNNWKNFQPRIGFAWNPNQGHLVVRGGYAINFDPDFYNIFVNAAASAPVANAGVIGCGEGYQCFPANGTTSATVRAQNLAALPTGGDPRQDIESPVSSPFRNPYAQTYSLGVQYGIGNTAVVEVRYVGNHTSHLFQAIDANPTLNTLANAFPNYVSPSSLCQDPTQVGFNTPNCNEGPFQSAVFNTAFSVYNSLQTNLTTRSFHGLTGTIEYTYSRTIDNASEIYATGAGGSTLEFAQNPLNTNLGERGVSGISYPNVTSFGFTYQVPELIHEKNLLSHATNGYSISAVYGYNSGQPFTPFEGLQSSGTYCDDTFNAAVLGVSSCRPILTNPSAPNSAASYIANSTLTAVNSPFPGVSRNTLRGQTFNNLDASVFKTTALTERVNLQLQFNVFNSLNRQYLGTPGAQLGATNFLTTAYNQGTNRFVQLGGKIIF
jgi:hypothetical protein